MLWVDTFFLSIFGCHDFFWILSDTKKGCPSPLVVLSRRPWGSPSLGFEMTRMWGEFASGKRLQFAMENHSFQWLNQLFLWQCSIAMLSDQRIRSIRNASFATLWRSTFAGSAKKKVEIYTFHVMMRGDILAFDHCPITSWWIKTHFQLIGIINLNCFLIKTTQNSSIQYQPPFPFPSWNQWSWIS